MGYRLYKNSYGGYDAYEIDAQHEDEKRRGGWGVFLALIVGTAMYFHLTPVHGWADKTLMTVTIFGAMAVGYWLADWIQFLVGMAIILGALNGILF